MMTSTTHRRGTVAPPTSPVAAVRNRVRSLVLRRRRRRPSEQLPIPPGKRGFLRRWIAAAMLALSAILVVVYVSNAIAVNDLLADITSLESERDVVRRENERLRAELLRLMSVERVTEIAGRLGMVQPAHPPVALVPYGARRSEPAEQRAPGVQ